MAGVSDARKAAQKAAREARKREQARQLREQRGYDPKAYREKDAQRSWSKASPETKDDYLKRVRTYENFLVEEKGMPVGYKVGKEHPVPTLDELKELFRWYIDSTKGKLDPEGRPTMKTTLIRAQQFVPGFALETGKRIPEQDATELYCWIEKDLVAEKFIKAIEKPKYNVKPGDFERGARVAALCPKFKHRAKRGLRYKHIQLVLFRTVDAPWKIGYRLDQHWVKNNVDPKNAALGAAIWDCDEPLYAGALLLLALAIADGALWGYSSAADFFEQVIPAGRNQLPLRWNDEALNRCIIRHTTAKGVSEDPLSKERYQEAFRQILRKIYLNTPTIHDYRRHLAESVKEKYTLQSASQLLGHKSTSVTAESYVASVCGVDGLNAARGRETDHTHIEYFQGYEQFYEQGLPRKLPIQKELELGSDALLVEMRAEIDNASTTGDRERLNAQYRAQKKRIYARELERFRKEWVRQRRDQFILTRGKECPIYGEQSAEKRTWCDIMPELGRLVTVMSSDEPLEFEAKRAVVEDLVIHCQRDYDVVYLPGQEPVEGRCPAHGCGKVMQDLKRPQRSSHIQSHMRREKSRVMGIPLARVKYCWECFSFHDAQSSDFEEHCASHLRSMTIQHYEVMVFRNTTVRAGYCIEYLRNHLEEHIKRKTWPSKCSGCSHISTDQQDYREHLHDVHHYNKAICVPSEKARKKRSSSDLDEGCIGDQDPPKRERRPRKQQKKSSASPHASPKDLKIILWEPPTRQHQAMFPLPAEAAHENGERLTDLAYQAVNHCGHFEQMPCTSPDDNSIHLALSDVMDVTDSPRHGAIGSVPSATVIDPRILDISTTSLSWPEEKHQHDYLDPREQLASSSLAERHGIDFPSQMLCADPALDSTESQGDTVPETGNALIVPTSSSQNPPRKQPVRRLTRDKLSAVAELPATTQTSSGVCTRGSKIEPGLASGGPLTRAKARAHAAKVHQRSTSTHISARKARPYSQKEDQLLKVLMRNAGFS
ncbi:hypothetical protein CNMCM8980_005978 [Aspergillus fumigatiaffinis]|uniref:FluG domain-containing protein n=1 Tax=Aspergillus fumigatiaffinis TaxID=340414 RepID=A0A8H4GRW5_9EURO|nr:hypothetical protein CNMCM6805_003283 [Aspergillus fumigatiaffinis]KAF4248425.1 hypothetical protein CNMCM8980_005978 [Aspergillus fumigatiaffinis]